MKNKLGVFFGATIIAVVSLAATLALATATTGPTLQIVQGSKDLERLLTSLEVAQPQELYLQWTTDQSAATGGTWQVTNVTAGNQLVASGETGQAPAIGRFARFTIPANAFLQSSPPASPVKFSITIVAHNLLKKPLGAVSPAVVVTQVPAGPLQPPINFGAGAMFPTVELVTLNEKIGVVQATQLHFAGADVTLRVSNTRPSTLVRDSSTNPIWLSIKDNSLLMRQNNPVRVPIPSLHAGVSQIINVHLDAILPPPTSQLPEEKQYAKWSQDYRDRCGLDLRAVMDWHGPQGQTPVDGHLETVLFPNALVCGNKQCLQTCKMARNIHERLDGNVVGYSFFVGLYPKFEAYGEARTSADTPKQSYVDFTPQTKITVASVSKMVTTIAAIRILEKRGVSLDAKIGPFLPSAWSATEIIPGNPPIIISSPVNSYFKDLTFAQLLSQHSGIMDYGNVPVGDYVTLRKFFTHEVSDAGTSCQKSEVEQPSDPINPNSSNPKGCSDPIPGWPCRCYSNYNFDILRILLPKVAGFAEDSNQSTRPQTLADQYVQLVQQNVFDLVGQKGVDCKPPAGSNDYAFSYLYPGSKEGKDWGDVSLRCGSAAWYLSVEDMARVLLSINAKDGKILSAKPPKDQFDMMRVRHLGWDVWKDGDLDKGGGELEKNGEWKARCDSDGNNCEKISTSIAIFGGTKGPRIVGVLFINSNISGGSNNQGAAQSVLEQAFADALVPKK